MTARSLRDLVQPAARLINHHEQATVAYDVRSQLRQLSSGRR